MTSAGGLLQRSPEGGGTQGFIGGSDPDLAGISGTLQQAVEVGFPQSTLVYGEPPEDGKPGVGLDDAGDLAGCQGSFEQLRTDISAYGEARDLSLRIQREDIFDAMHKL